MADIAAEASVAVQTLYLSFGSKARILSATFDRSVAGDDEALAVLERPWVSALADEPDLRQALRLLVAEGTAYRLFCMDRGWEPCRWQAWCLTSLQTTLADPPGAAAGLRLDMRHDAVQPPRR